MGTASENGREEDVVLIQGTDRVRSELHVLRKRRDRVEAAVVRPVEEGRPVDGDIVKLKPRPGTPFLCDVETVMIHPDAARPVRSTHAGPPMVASEAYRRGWDAVFGATPDDTGSEAN